MDGGKLLPDMIYPVNTALNKSLVDKVLSASLEGLI
jgi:hypothetical protein